jgi:hypothetical protein
VVIHRGYREMHMKQLDNGNTLMIEWRMVITCIEAIGAMEMGAIGWSGSLIMDIDGNEEGS